MGEVSKWREINVIVLRAEKKTTKEGQRVQIWETGKILTRATNGIALTSDVKVE